MIVLDCNAAAEIVRETTLGKALASLMEKDEEVISTQLFVAEANSTMSKYVRAGLANIELAHRQLENMLDLVDYFVDMNENYVEAFDEGIRNNHSTYDMFYLTLARRNGATLFTLDKRLRDLCNELKIDCVQLADLN